MRVARVARVAAMAGIAGLLLITLLASPSAAQSRAGQGPPIVRVYSQNGPGVASNYVTPAIEVSEDAYVFAVSLDLDGQIQVLHPDFPGISVRIAKRRELRLPNFFTGFSTSSEGGAYSPARYPGSESYADNDSRGTIIAIASREPFALDRVESDGDWNMLAIRRLIEHRSPISAAQELATYLGARGEPIGRDYMRFASVRHYYYASEALYNCDLFYGGYSSTWAFSRLAVLDRVARLNQAGQNARIVGYDFCGMPIVAYGPSRSAVGPGVPPRHAADGILAGHNVPRTLPRSAPEAGTSPRDATLRYAPITRRAEPPPMGDVTIVPPNDRRRDPGEILIDLRNVGRAGGVSEHRMPVDRGATTPSETTVIGTQPVGEYSRPVIREAPPAPRSDPAPARVPDRSPPPPAPTVRERPSSPPPASSPRTTEGQLKPTSESAPPAKR